MVRIEQKPDFRPIVEPPLPPPIGAIFLLFYSIFEFPFSATKDGEGLQDGGLLGSVSWRTVKNG